MGAAMSMIEAAFGALNTAIAEICLWFFNKIASLLNSLWQKLKSIFRSGEKMKDACKTKSEEDALKKMLKSGTNKMCDDIKGNVGQSAELSEETKAAINDAIDDFQSDVDAAIAA